MDRIRTYLSWALLELSDATLTDLSPWVHRDVSSLSSAARRLRDKAKKFAEIEAEM